jgi:hypothetical protein
MRIDSLQISNYKAITSLELSGLKNTVVIAGMNGCGKSCIFDAIRLLKSLIGGYDINEYDRWRSEFQVQNEDSEVFRLLQDSSKPLTVRVTLAFSKTEIDYVKTNARKLLEDYLYTYSTPNPIFPAQRRKRGLGGLSESEEERLKKQVEDHVPPLLSCLSNTNHSAHITLGPSTPFIREATPLVRLVFSTYEPQHIGIIDYHGPNRQYNKENFNTVNLNIETERYPQRRVHALYEYNQKYANLKTHMASSYIRAF